MTAFLSHSSKDKGFVEAVAAEMGPLEYELDSETFDYTLNVRAIRRALARSNVAVFFLSAHSVASSFVAEEQRQTLEAIGKAAIKRVIVFTIDDTGFRSLPDWLRDHNVVQRVNNPKICARRIQALLLEADLEDEPEMLYLGRDADEAALRKVLRAPAAETPVALHMVGFHGIGRRTFLQQTLGKLFPRLYAAFPTITVSRYQGVDDIYRSIYRLVRFSSNHEQVVEFTQFSDSSFPRQVELITELIFQMAEQGEMLTVFDDGSGILTEAGEYYPHWSGIIQLITQIRRPVISFIQTRVQPFRYRLPNTVSFYQKLDALSLEAAKEIIAFSLKQKSVDFTGGQVEAIAKLSGGHPFNIRFAVGLAANYEVEPFLADPRSFIAWRDRRGEEFLAEISFDELECDIIAILLDYKYLATAAVIQLLSKPLGTVMEALRNLQDFCCVEFRDGMFHLASPIQEAARRDERFMRDADWHRNAAEIILQSVSEYESAQDVPLSLIETATLAAVRTNSAPEYIRLLVLPSHLLLVAREQYDQGRRVKCIELSRQAFEYRNRMTIDAQVETLRIWALSAARLGDQKEFAEAKSHLAALRNPASSRALAFVEGLKARIEGREDDAERFYKEAWELAPNNASINRELAKLYLRQKQYADAEAYARQAYNISPTNPFVLDIMVDMLQGKQVQGLGIDRAELQKMVDELQHHGNEPGFSFFSVREAQKLIGAKQFGRAVEIADDAIAKTPELPAPYFIKIEALLRLPGRVREAESALETVKAILNEKGLSEGEASSLAEAEVSLLLEKRDYARAKSKLDAGPRFSRRVQRRYLDQLARSIGFDPGPASRELRDWAKAHSKGA